MLNKVQVHDRYAPAHKCAHDSAWAEYEMAQKLGENGWNKCHESNGENIIVTKIWDLPRGVIHARTI